jgi:hypothetical protein
MLLTKQHDCCIFIALGLVSVERYIAFRILEGQNLLNTHCQDMFSWSMILWIASTLLHKSTTVVTIPLGQICADQAVADQKNRR